MANESNGLAALAIGAGAGLAIWHFFGDRIFGRSDAPADKARESTTPAAGAAPLPPTKRACQLALDARGLRAEGVSTDPSGAVSMCRAVGASRADLTVTSDAPAATLGSLVFALGAAQIQTNVIRK